METNQTSMDRRVVAGLLLVAAGGLLLLDRVELLPFSLSHYLISWKTLLIGIGIIVLASRENRTTGLILVGLGLIFWMPELFDYHIRLSTIFWPSMLIGIGLIIISRRGGSRHTDNTHAHIFSAPGQAGVNKEDYIDELAIFGGGNIKMVSTNFRGGRVTAIFGGSDIDMKTAIPSADGCVIDVFVVFGGAKLIVSDDWQVKSEMVSIFGGFSDKRVLPATENSAKLVIIKGVTLFGGVEIKSY